MGIKKRKPRKLMDALDDLPKFSAEHQATITPKDRRMFEGIAKYLPVKWGNATGTKS